MGSIGSLLVSIGADVSGFTEAAGSVLTGLDSIGSKAATAGSDFTDGIITALNNAAPSFDNLTSHIGSLVNDLDPFASAAQQVGEALTAATPPAFAFSSAAQEIVNSQAGLAAAAQEAQTALQEIQTAYEGGSASAGDLASAQANLQSALAAANPTVEDSSSNISALGTSLSDIAGMVGVALTLGGIVEGIKSLAEESLTAYGNLQLTTAALTALTGSADSANTILDSMKDLASSTIFSFPDLASAAQKMAALGVAAGQIPAAMQAVSTAAEVTGNGLDSATSALDRMYLSATVSPRSLSQLGLSMQDLADTMGVSVDQVAATFKTLGPESDAALQILVSTIDSKMAAASDAMTSTLPVTINSLKTQWDLMLEDFGQAMAPDVSLVLTRLQSLIPVIDEVASGFLEIAANMFKLGPSVPVPVIPPEAVSSLSTYQILVNELGSAFGSLGGITTQSTGQVHDATDAFAAQAAAGQKAEAATIAQNAALATQIISEAGAADATQSAVAAAQAAMAAAQFNVDSARQSSIAADAALVSAEQALQNVIATHTTDNVALKAAEDDVTVAKANAKASNDILSESEKALTASKTDDNAVTALLKAATTSIADAIKTDHVPAVMSLVDAENAVAAAHQATVIAVQNEQAASAALSAAQQAGFPDDTNEAQLKANLQAAIAATTASRQTEAGAITDASKIKAADAQLDTDSLANIKLIDSYTKDNYLVTLASLSDAITNIDQLKQQQLATFQDLQDAQTTENDLINSGVTDINLLTAAHTEVKAAQDAYKTSTDQVNTALTEAQKNYGLSKDDIIALGAAMPGATQNAGTLQAAFNTLGVKSSTSLSDMATAADAAYADILASGTASSQQLLQAQIADINAQVAAATAAGTSIPAAQQLQLAQMKTQEANYIANSTTQWSTLYTNIQGDFTGMFNGLFSDFFSGQNFETTITTALQKVGTSILTTVFKPLTDAFSTWITGTLTGLLKTAFGGITSSLTGSLTSAINPVSTITSAAAGAVNPISTITDATATAATDAATTATDAASTTADAATSAASDATSAAGSVVSGAMGMVGSISSAVSAVTGLLAMFGVGNSGDQLDRLNHIDDATTYLAWVFSAAGGLDALLLTEENTANSLLGFGGWFLTSLGWISDRVTDNETWNRTSMGYLAKLAGGAGLPAAAAPSTTTAAQTAAGVEVLRSAVVGSGGVIADTIKSANSSLQTTFSDTATRFSSSVASMAAAATSSSAAAPPANSTSGGPQVEYVNVSGFVTIPGVDPFASLETTLAGLLTDESGVEGAVVSGLGELKASLLASAANTNSYLSDLIVSAKAAAASLLSMDARDASLAAKAGAAGIVINNTIQGNVLGNADFLNQLSQQIATVLKTQGVTA